MRPSSAHGGARVTAVIPTRDRPELVARAVASALAQTWDDLEVIVVVDGPDPATVTRLGAIGDGRLRVHLLATRGGPGAARNAGVVAARGEWIAFLDDDDEWLPKKLAIQMDDALRARAEIEHPVVSCRALRRTIGPDSDSIWPRRMPRADEPLGDYLLRRQSILGDDGGLVVTSAILTRRALLREVAFDADLERHEDLDWLLRVGRRDDVRIRFVTTSDPLVIWHDDPGRERITSRPDWRASLAWIDRRRDLVTSEAYASFVLAWIGAKAAAASERRALPLLIRQAYRHGAPSARDVVVALGCCAMPASLRRCVVSLVRSPGHDATVRGAR
jgi:glycosyltransferase involved in cell wall biosynthesis